jgi:arylsulfatase A-like enzyme
MFDPATIPPPIHDSLEGKPERQKVAKYLDFNHSYDDDHFRQVRAIHYGMIRQIDDNLARFFAELDAQGLTDDTIVVFLSDHGDAMGDHGIIQKHNFFYDSFTRVPFVVSWPGKIEPRQTDELAELVDVMPTVLDLAGVEIPFGVQGASLAPFLTGKAVGTKDHVVIESGEHGNPPQLSEVLDAEGNVVDRGTSFAWCAFREAWMGKGKAIRTKEWKLCLYANGEGELYDVKNDPDELENLYGRESHAAVQAELTYRLAIWQMYNDDRIPTNPTVADRMHLRR